MALPRRVLLVSWLFPPHGSIGAKRAYHFARHLPAEGWKPTVVCRRRPPPASVDPSPWPLPPEVDLRPDYDSAFWSVLADRGARWVLASSGRGAPVARRSWRERVGDRLDLFVDALVPTETAALHAPHAWRALDRLAPHHDVLWTTSYPYSAHVAGLLAARRHGRRFVADLRDPWTPNWVHERKFFHARWVERRLEQAVFDAADAITVTTETLADLYRERFPQHAHKFVAIHNSFDPVPGTHTPRSPGAPVVLVHFGNVYGPWSLGTVFHALRLLRDRGLAPPGAFRLENYGKLADRDRVLALELGVGDLVHVHPAVPFAEGFERLRAADLLVLAAWDAPDARLYVQGKFFDYLAAGSEILAESDNPELVSLLERTGAGTCVAPGAVEAVAVILTRVLRGGVPETVRDADAIAYFSAPAATRRLAALFERLLETR